MKRHIAALLGVIMLAGAIVNAPVEVHAESNWPSGPDIVSPSAVVMEVKSGAVLYEKNAHKQLYPASITKILTTWLTVENCDLSETITFSKTAVYENEGDTSHIYRDVGEEMTVEETLLGVMLASANECAYAAAEHVGTKAGGDYRTFIDMMNERAAELGCEDTHFNNANGLPDEEHYTSAYDMGLIGCGAYKNDAFKKIAGTPKFTIPPTNKHSDPTYLSNHHNILHYYNTSKYVNPYCTGGKTGYTKVARSTLVTYAEKDGLAICVVVMNTESPNQWTDTNKLIDFAFNNFKALNISQNEESIEFDSTKDAGILNNNGSFVTFDDSSYIVLPKTADFSDAKFEKDNVVTDHSIASLRYTYAGRNVGSVDIVTTGATMDVEYFNDNSALLEKEANTIRIPVLYVVLVIIAFIALIVFIILLRGIIENFYVMKHDFAMRRSEKQRFKVKKQKSGRRRKRDIMFK